MCVYVQVLPATTQGYHVSQVAPPGAAEEHARHPAQ